MVGVAFLWGARQPSMCSPAVARLPSGPEPRSSEPLRPSAGAVGPGSLGPCQQFLVVQVWEGTPQEPVHHTPPQEQAQAS